MLTKEERIDMARTIIENAADDVVFLSVVEMTAEEHGERVERADELAIHDMIRSATITVEIDGE